MKSGIKQDIEPAQLRAARGLLNWSREDLGSKSGASGRTIARIEDGETMPRASTLASIIAALEKAGVQFIPENGGGAGVRLAKKKKR
jgi:predicted transcriptional regulator